MKIVRHNYTQHSDEELAALYKQSGQLPQLAALYERYMPLVFGVCLKYFKNEEAAQDAVMNIFEELVNKLRVYPVQSFKAWLHTLTRNHCLGVLRRQQGRTTVSLDESFVESEQPVHLDFDEVKEARLTAMEACLAELNEQQRGAVQMFYLEKKCYKEIADATGFDMSKVKSYIQNGKRNLKLCIERKTNGQ